MSGQQEQQQRTHYVKVNTKGDIENRTTDLNDNDEELEIKQTEWSDGADLPCLRYANPIMLFTAVAVVFTTVFCIMFYGSMNSRGFINNQVILPPDFDAVDITNSSVPMVTGKLLKLYHWDINLSTVFLN